MGTEGIEDRISDGFAVHRLRHRAGCEATGDGSHDDAGAHPICDGGRWHRIGGSDYGRLLLPVDLTMVIRRSVRDRGWRGYRPYASVIRENSVLSCVIALEYYSRFPPQARILAFQL